MRVWDVGGASLYLGDCRDVLGEMPDACADLIVTSPPYAQRRKKTYGGIPACEYVEWFLPRSAQMLRVLKSTGTFILNIKEHAENGERSVYVLELILALRRQGWLWTEEFIWHKKNAYPGRCDAIQQNPRFYFKWPVLGGGVIVMFGMVAAAGLNMLSEVKMTRRNMAILAVSLSAGLGLKAVPLAVQFLPETAKLLLTTGLLPVAVIAFVLNIILPEEKSEPQNNSQ